MIFALNYPVATEWVKVVDELPFMRRWAVKGCSAGVLVGALGWWVTSILPLDKGSYNLLNPYLSPLFALLTYVYLRNLSPWLRSRFLGPLEIIGKTTLETYLLQHHWWLTSNAKTLLNLVPGFPTVNFVVVTVLFFWGARQLNMLTLSIRGMLLPDDLSKCLVNMAGAAVAVVVSYGVAVMSEAMFGGSLVAVAMVASLLGMGMLLAIAWWLRQSSANDPMPAVSALVQCGVVFAALFVALAMVAAPWFDSPATPQTQCGPPPKATTNQICSMGHPGLGIMILAVSALMLVTRDSYLGVPTAVLFVFERKFITWDQAYVAFHSKCGIVETVALPTVEHEAATVG